MLLISVSIWLCLVRMVSCAVRIVDLSVMLVW